MGRAEILANMEDGRYRVAYKYNYEQVQLEVQRLDALIDDLINARAEQEATLSALQAHASSVVAALRAMLTDGLPMDDAKRKRITAQLVLVNNAALQVNMQIAAVEDSKIQQQAALDRQQRFNKLKAHDVKTLWIADYSLSIEPTGADLPVMEIAGESGTDFDAVLYPANDQAPVPWSPGRFGDRTHALSLSKEGCFAASALFPGWQKFLPLYRFGKILSFPQKDFAQVQLIEPLKSSQQQLKIPPSNPYVPKAEAEGKLDLVPVRYMDCNAAAFKVGDHVVIEYEGLKSDKPVVIGFAKYPKPCPDIQFWTPRERLMIPHDSWDRREETGQQYGNAYWVGRSGALSWYGYGGRHFEHPNDPQAGPSVFRKGKLLATAPGRVRGACLHLKGKVEWLIVVCREKDNFHDGSGNDEFWALNLSSPAPVWILLHSQSYGAGAPDLVNVSANHWESVWFFNESGTEGVCVKRQMGARPDEYEDTFSRMVGFRINFDGEVPTGMFLWHSVRKYVATQADTFDEGCGSVGVLGTDCITNIETVASTHRYDILADFVGDELVTFDEIVTGGSVNRIECGPLFECFSLDDIRATNVVKTDEDYSTTRLLCPALNYSEIRASFRTTFRSTYSQEIYEQDEENCGPIVTQIDEDITTWSGHFVEWLDFQGGAGKVHEVYRDVHNVVNLGGTQTRAYPIGGGVITTNSDPVDNSSHGSTAVLRSKGQTTNLGGLAESPAPFVFDPHVSQSFWAAADRNGHCLVSSEQFDNTVGSPDLPVLVLRTFQPVGIG